MRRLNFFWALLGVALLLALVASPPVQPASTIEAAQGVEGQAEQARPNTETEAVLVNTAGHKTCGYPDNCQPPPAQCRVMQTAAVLTGFFREINGVVVTAEWATEPSCPVARSELRVTVDGQFRGVFSADGPEISGQNTGPGCNIGRFGFLSAIFDHDYLFLAFDAADNEIGRASFVSRPTVEDCNAISGVHLCLLGVASLTRIANDVAVTFAWAGDFCSVTSTTVEVTALNVAASSTGNTVALLLPGVCPTTSTPSYTVTGSAQTANGQTVGVGNPGNRLSISITPDLCNN